MSAALSRRRKLAWGAVTTLLALVALEGSARVYSLARHGNPHALAYGLDFFRQAADGTLRQRQNYPFADVEDQLTATDKLFVERHDPHADDGFVERPQGRMVAAGGLDAWVNRFGFRGEEFDRPLVAGATRIAVFGGSFVFGHGLRDEDTWPVLLEDRLQEYGGQWRVLNAGENGTNIHGTTGNLIRVSKRIPFEVAVVVSAYNNHALLSVTRQYGWARRLDFYLYNVSVLHTLVKEKMGLLAQQPLDYGLYRQRVAVVPEDLDALIQVYRTRLLQIAEVCRERGIALVLGAQPQRFFDADIDARHLMDEDYGREVRARLDRGEPIWLMELAFLLQHSFNREAQSVARAVGAGFVDLTDLYGGEKPQFFLDQIHPNAAGSHLIANALADYLIGRRQTETETHALPSP